MGAVLVIIDWPWLLNVGRDGEHIRVHVLH